MANGRPFRAVNVSIFSVLPAVLFYCMFGGVCHAGDPNELPAAIDRLAALGESAPGSLIDSIRDRIEKDPASASSVLCLRLSRGDLNDNQLAITLWALTFAKAPACVDAVIAIAGTTQSELVKANSLRALASIGGGKSGDYLMAELAGADEPEYRFELMNLLAQMQYEPALEKTEEVLKLDYQRYYWQSIFIFGKMGDQAVPFLLKRISDTDKNVRANALHILGQWLIAPEAAEGFGEQYRKEQETDLRELILSSLERITPDPAEIEAFFSQAAASEEDGSLVKFARETVDNIEEMKTAIRQFGASKQASREQFQAEYDALYRSAGKTGDYEILSKTSGFEDEPRLKKLRERILQRDSDESFYDYQKINRIIILNRFLHRQTAP